MTAGVNNRTRAQQWEYPEAFFREAIVIVHTGFTERTESRDACVASYEDFCRQAAIPDFKINNPGIDVFGHTAIATYSWITSKPSKPLDSL